MSGNGNAWRGPRKGALLSWFDKICGEWNSGGFLNDYQFKYMADFFVLSWDIVNINFSACTTDPLGFT